jgi:hypothetical protein
LQISSEDIEVLVLEVDGPAFSCTDPFRLEHVGEEQRLAEYAFVSMKRFVSDFDGNDISVDDG